MAQLTAKLQHFDKQKKVRIKVLTNKTNQISIHPALRLTQHSAHNQHQTYTLS
jgi:hypothetical protein